MCMGLNKLRVSVVVEKREELRGESEKRRVKGEMMCVNVVDVYEVELKEGECCCGEE